MAKINKNAKIQVGIVLILSLLILFVSPYVMGRTVESPAELENMKFGFPFSYVEQSQVDVVTKFPAEVVMKNPITNPSTVSVIGLSLDFLFWFLAMAVVYGGLKRVILRIIKK